MSSACVTVSNAWGPWFEDYTLPTCSVSEGLWSVRNLNQLVYISCLIIHEIVMLCTYMYTCIIAFLPTNPVKILGLMEYFEVFHAGIRVLLAKVFEWTQDETPPRCPKNPKLCANPCNFSHPAQIATPKSGNILPGLHGFKNHKSWIVKMSELSPASNSWTRLRQAKRMRAKSSEVCCGSRKAVALVTVLHISHHIHHHLSK